MMSAVPVPHIIVKNESAVLRIGEAIKFVCVIDSTIHSLVTVKVWYFEEGCGTLKRVVWYFEEGGVVL